MCPIFVIHCISKIQWFSLEYVDFWSKILLFRTQNRDLDEINRRSLCIYKVINVLPQIIHANNSFQYVPFHFNKYTFISVLHGKWLYLTP